MSQPPVPPPVSAPSPNWFRRRVVDPLQGLLRQGLTPHQLALTIVLGSAFGVVPVLGITTLLATATAVRLRLNVAATLLIAHLWSPVQLLLIIPLMQLGARLWGGSAEPQLSLEKLRYLFAHDGMGAVRLLWQAIVGGLAVWAVVAVPVGVALYFVLRPILSRVMARKAALPQDE